MKIAEFAIADKQTRLLVKTLQFFYCNRSTADGLQYFIL